MFNHFYSFLQTKLFPEVIADVSVNINTNFKILNKPGVKWMKLGFIF